MEVKGIFLLLLILYADCNITNALQVRTDVKVVTSISSDAKLWCNLTDDSVVISYVSWSHENDHLVTCYNSCVTANYSLTINRNEATSTLIVPNVQQEDGGPYWCKVSTGSEHATKLVTLVVKEPPTQPVLTWSREEPLSESSSDNSLNITCQASSIYGNPYVVWKKESEIVSEVTQSGSATLHFAVLTRNASGLYTCEVDNGIPPCGKTVADINVRYPPEILKNVTWLTATGGYPASIHCIIDANPPPLAIIWTSPNDVFEERQRVTVFKTKYQSIVRSTLEISVKYGSTLCQSYTCSVMNIEGSDNHTIEVCIEDPPEIVKNVSNMIANDVTYTTIDCIIDTNPSPIAINWTSSGGGYSGNHRETEIFKYENRLVLRSTLQITVASMSRACENYTCSATNVDGQDNHTIQLCKSASPGHPTSLCKTLRCPLSIPGMLLLVLGFILLVAWMCWLRRRHTVNRHKRREYRIGYGRRGLRRRPRNSNGSSSAENGKDVRAMIYTQDASDAYNLQSNPIGIYQCDAVFDDDGDLYATTINRTRGRCVSSEHSTTDDPAVDERSCSTDTPSSHVIRPYSRSSHSMEARKGVRKGSYDNPVSYQQTNTYEESYLRGHMYYSLEVESTEYTDVMNPDVPSQGTEYACIEDHINDNPFYSCRE